MTTPKSTANIESECRHTQFPQKPMITLRNLEVEKYGFKSCGYVYMSVNVANELSD